MSRTKVFRASPSSASLKGTIPSDVASALKLKDGDEIEWDLTAEGSRIIAKVVKAKEAR